MKKYIITENQLKNVIDNVLNENVQLNEDDRKAHFTMVIQEFLNKKLNLNLVVDGKTGPGSNTEKALAKYQSMINATPDGVWGEKTYEKMPEEDKKLFNSFKKKHGFSFFGF